MSYAGELAAVGTAVCWACAAAFFVSAGRRMGSVQLNRLRLVVALVPLLLTLWIVRGAPWPSATSEKNLLLMTASGVVVTRH